MTNVSFNGLLICQQCNSSELAEEIWSIFTELNQIKVFVLRPLG